MDSCPGEYAQIFSDVNAVLNERNYSSIQVTKTKQINNIQLSATLTPTQIALSSQFAPTQQFSASVNFDTALNGQVSLNLATSDLKSTSTVEFTPVYNQTIQDAIQGISGKYMSHDVNFRNQLNSQTQNTNSSLLYNKRGHIIAGSSLVQLGNFQTGFEAVHVASRNITLQAAALKYQKGCFQVVSQANSTKTAALGVVIQRPKFAVSAKIQGAPGAFQGIVGAIFGVQGGQFGVNVDATGLIQTSLKAGVSGGVLEVGSKFRLNGQSEVGFSLIV